VAHIIFNSSRHLLLFFLSENFMTMMVLVSKIAWIAFFKKKRKRKKKSVSFLEYTRELHIIALR